MTVGWPRWPSKVGTVIMLEARMWFSISRWMTMRGRGESTSRMTIVRVSSGRARAPMRSGGRAAALPKLVDDDVALDLLRERADVIGAMAEHDDD